MGVLTLDALLDFSEDTFSTNKRRLDYLAEQLAEGVAVANFSEYRDRYERGYNQARAQLSILAEIIVCGIFEPPSMLEKDQFEDWFIGRAVMMCGFRSNAPNVTLASSGIVSEVANG